MHKTKSKVSVIRLVRAGVQILFFIFLPGLYISAFSGVRQIVLSLLHHSFDPAALLPQIVATLAILPLTLILGRFFCGWMCAFGSLGDFIYEAAAKIRKRRPRIGETPDRLLKLVKYVWLAVLIGVVWIAGFGGFQSANPWDAFGMLLTVGKPPALGYVLASLLPAFLLLVGILIGSVFVRRFFCRYLCPLGAVFAIFSTARVTGIRKERAGCGRCRACTNACPMGIPLYKKDVCRSGECIDCLACVAACPRGNAVLAVSESRVRPAAAGVLTVAAITGLYYAGSFSADLLSANAAAASVSSSAQSGASQGGAVSDGAAQGGQSSASSSSAGGQTPAAGSPSSGAASSAPSSQAASKYKDGTYQGSGTGFRGGTTTVTVTVQGGKITDVRTVSTDDDAPFFNRAYSSVAQAIIRSQSPQVDTVSGATYSSNGIMRAVANALTKAV